MTSLDLIDYATQLRAEIREGELLKAQLQHMKREGSATQADVNEVEADVSYLRRERQEVLLRAEAIIRDVTVPEALETAMTREVLARLKGRAA